MITQTKKSFEKWKYSNRPLEEDNWSIHTEMTHAKDYILSVFNEILKKYPMSKITVAQIVEKAGISKSTFYRNYIDKYDIMNYTYKKLIDSNIQSIDNLVPDWD